MRPDVMIVDDSRDQLELMRVAFKMVAPHISVATYESGEQALLDMKAHADKLPKVILLDLKMPGKNGVEILNNLKASPQIKKVPVCMFSNGDLDKDICTSYDRGASSYFKKPTGLEELKGFITYFTNIWFKYCSHCQCDNHTS